jgi:hypothetical protein
MIKNESSKSDEILRNLTTLNTFSQARICPQNENEI